MLWEASPQFCSRKGGDQSRRGTQGYGMTDLNIHLIGSAWVAVGLVMDRSFRHAFIDSRLSIMRRSFSKAEF